MFVYKDKYIENKKKDTVNLQHHLFKKLISLIYKPIKKLFFFYEIVKGFLRLSCLSCSRRASTISSI